MLKEKKIEKKNPTYLPNPNNQDRGTANKLFLRIAWGILWGFFLGKQNCSNIL